MSAFYMRNPAKWIGKTCPSNLKWSHHLGTIDKCDDCQRLFATDDLHALLYPISPDDFNLQRSLRIEEAQGFCPDCLELLERDADSVDPDWRRRHGLK